MRGQTYFHPKSGHRYVVESVGLLEADLTPVVVYREIQAKGFPGRVWVRPVEEFCDGRFRPEEGTLEIKSDD